MSAKAAPRPTPPRVVVGTNANRPVSVVGKELVRLWIGRGLVERLYFWMDVAIG